MSNQLDINEIRLWDSLHKLAEIGATPEGGVRRLAYTPDDRAGRSYFVQQCENLGMSIEKDGIGNIFATLLPENKAHQNLSIMVGSHLDSQANGGKFDGTYGVMCGLEIARNLVQHKIPLEVCFELAVWANEEGARFAPPMMGSGAFVGQFEISQLLKTKDLDGISVQDALDEDDWLKSRPFRSDRKIAAYLESHIEQGPILEKENKTIGVVTGAQAVRWLNVQIDGFQAHAGPTPMDYRNDAFLAACEVALAAEKIALNHPPNGRATIGHAIVDDPSRNVIPGAVELWVDIRYPEEKNLEIMQQELKRQCLEIESSRGVKIRIESIWSMKATHFNPNLISLLRKQTNRLNLESMDMISGAGHDALHMALKYPTAMLFIPCKNGISHNPAEDIIKYDAAQGCQVLYDTLRPLLIDLNSIKGIT